MGYFKKFISQMLCILIIVGVLIGGSSATAQETYTESEKINYNENIDLVKKLGILEERENPEISYLVTRGEFAKIILKTMGYGQLASNATYKPIFSDVTEETPYYSYILWANELGYLTGVGNGKFAPDEYLTGEQVIKSFVSAIGYGILAEEKGGYPEGYMLQANKLGILDNVELQMGYPITYYNLANILCNTLTVDFMVKSEFTNDSSYEISKKSNILSKIFNLVQYKGVVTSTEMTNLVKNTRSSKNQIEINDKAYSIEGSYNYLIGQKVDYYVNTEKDNEIKFILEKSKYNIISTVNAMNIDDYKDQTYYYTKSQNEGKIYEKNISGAYILYNGKAWSNGIEKEMLPKSGKVTFIDNNCDGKQDVVIVTNYRTVVVNDVDNEKKVIGDTIEPAYPIEVNDSDFLSIKDTENNEIDFNKISKNDILSVASSKDNDIVNIIVSKNSVTGIVNGMKKGAEGTLKSIKVDEKEYKINNDTFESDSNIIGMKYRIGLDFEGRAASINKKNESSNNIGYLINASGEHENKNVEFKVFDISADKVKIMNGAEKIKIDKKMCKNNKTILNALKKFKPGASDIEKDETKVLSEIISYKLNENEEIVEIDTPYNYLTDSVGEYENIPVPDDEDSKS
ncbi:MAG: S-layer homology domain-containing protein, partial [Oscillospiraceae bacterium]